MSKYSHLDTKERKLSFSRFEEGIIWKETLRFSNSDVLEATLSDSLLAVTYFYTSFFVS